MIAAIGLYTHDSSNIIIIIIMFGPTPIIITYIIISSHYRRIDVELTADLSEDHRTYTVYTTIYVYNIYIYIHDIHVHHVTHIITTRKYYPDVSLLL